MRKYLAQVSSRQHERVDRPFVDSVRRFIEHVVSKRLDFIKHVVKRRCFRDEIVYKGFVYIIKVDLVFMLVHGLSPFVQSDYGRHHGFGQARGQHDDVKARLGLFHSGQARGEASV